MGEVPGRNTRESLLDGIREEVQAADFPAAQDGFHLGPHVLNRVEIRAVGRKVQCFHTLCLQNFPDSLYMARTHVVHHYDVTRRRGGSIVSFKYWTKRSPVVPPW